MENFTTNKTTSFAGGTIIGLSSDQAASRAGSLKKIGKDKYQVLSRIMFKAGENILLDSVGKDVAENFGVGKAVDSKGRTDDEKALLDLEQDLKAKLAEVEASKSTLLEIQKDLDKRRVDLDAREGELETRESELNEKDALLTVKENDLSKKTKPKATK